MRLLLALLLLPGLALGAEAVPDWAIDRDGSGNIRVNGGPLGTFTFTEEWQSTYPLESSNPYNKNLGGTNQPPAVACVPADRVMYDWTVDGYEGRGPGSCLTPGACPQYDSKDLAHPAWSDSAFRHVVVKNWNLQNAFKTSEPPHVDVTQILDSPGFGGWVVVQDSVLRNSDDGIVQFQMGYTNSACLPYEGVAQRNFGGLVLQNVDMGNDSNFISDCQTRPGDAVCVQGNTVGSWNGPNEGWFINVDNDGWPLRLHQNWEKVVVVGTLPEFTFRSSPAVFAFSTDTPCTGGNCSYGSNIWGPYPNIEAAIAAGHSEPPFARLSCSGWADPSNCSTAPVTGVEIEVTGYPDGTSTYTFPNTNQDATDPFIDFTISNPSSDSSLTISSATVTGAPFSITTAPAGSVAAGGTTTVRVTLDTATAGVFTDSLVINNNDADEGTYTIDLAAEVLSALDQSPPTVTASTLFTTSITPSISCTAGAVCYCTTDDSTPDNTDPLCSALGSLTETTTLKVRAFDEPDYGATITREYVLADFIDADDAAWTNLEVTVSGTTPVLTWKAAVDAAGVDVVMTFSDGLVATWDDSPGAIRFFTGNEFDARNSTVYAADATVSYSPFVEYEFQVSVDLTADTYDVEVRPVGGSYTLIADDYSFRETVPDLSDISYVSLYAQNGNVGIADISAGGALPTPDPAPELTTPGFVDGGNYNFPNADVGDAQPTIALLIQNTGDAPLGISNWSVTGGFSPSSEPNFTIQAGQQTTITLSMDTEVAGNYTGQVAFSTNDADESEFFFNLTGSVLAVAAGVSSDVIGGPGGFDCGGGITATSAGACP